MNKRNFTNIEDAQHNNLFCYELDGQEAGTYVLTTNCPEEKIMSLFEEYHIGEYFNKGNFDFFLKERNYFAISGEKTNLKISLIN